MSKLRTGEDFPTIAVQDIRNYLQSLEMGEYAATPNDVRLCLSAQSLYHKYGYKIDIYVGLDLITFYEFDVAGSYEFSIPLEVRSVTDKFDAISEGGFGRPLTRAEVEKFIPELAGEGKQEHA